MQNLWTSRLLVARTYRKSQNFDVLVARTWKNYENRVFLWPEHLKNLWKSRLSWVSCPISVYGLLNTQLSDKYLYLYLAQLKSFKKPTFLALCLLLLQAALLELDRLLLCLAVSAVLNSLLLHFAMLYRLLLHATLISIRDVQRWLAEEPIASCSSADMLRIREAVAVLSRPKPRKEDVRPLQSKWQVAQKKTKSQDR